jgi:hypothetical protein
MSNVKAVWQAIKTKADCLTRTQGVFDYDTGKTTGYPFATVTPSDGESEFGDSMGSGRGRNIQTMRFSVKIWQEREETAFGAEKAQRVAVEVLDEVLTAFHADTTLSGTVLWQRPISWSQEDEGRELLVKLLEVTIEAVKDIDTM